jgi:hypothetical protein
VHLPGIAPGSFFGAPPTGKKVEINGTAILRIREGKIIEHWGGPLHARHWAVERGRAANVCGEFIAARSLGLFYELPLSLKRKLQGRRCPAPRRPRPATVNKSLAHLERVGVVAELTRKQRGRVFSYARYVDILNEGMEVPGTGR